MTGVTPLNVLNERHDVYCLTASNSNMTVSSEIEKQTGLADSAERQYMDPQEQQYESRWAELPTEPHLAQAITYWWRQKPEVSPDEDLCQIGGRKRGR